MTAPPREPTNTGHGHVWERPDGVKMRCGGPGICAVCSQDYVVYHAAPAPSAEPPAPSADDGLCDTCGQPDRFKHERTTPAAQPAEASPADKAMQRYNAIRARLRSMGDAMAMPMAVPVNCDMKLTPPIPPMAFVPKMPAAIPPQAPHSP